MFKSLLSLATGALGGIQGYLIAGALALVIGGAGGAYAAHRWDAGTIANLKLADAVAAKTAISTALATAGKVAAANQKAAAAEGQTQERIVTLTNTIIRKVPVYVTPQQDAVACVTFGFVRLLYSAERGLDPASLVIPAGQSDDACTALKLSDLAAGLASDYGTSRQNSEQLNALETAIAANDATAQGVAK